MSDATEEQVQEKPPQPTHAGQMHDPSLNQLRDQIKKIMIPLLIKIFQFKLELDQTLSLPSRLHASKHTHNLDDITNHLAQLDKDLKALLLWCHSCRHQIQKALNTAEEELRHPNATTDPVMTHPAVAKSFTDLLTTPAPSSSHSNPLQGRTLNTTSSSQSPRSSKKWWRLLFPFFS